MNVFLFHLLFVFKIFLIQSYVFASFVSWRLLSFYFFPIPTLRISNMGQYVLMARQWQSPLFLLFIFSLYFFLFIFGCLNSQQFISNPTEQMYLSWFVSFRCYCYYCRFHFLVGHFFFYRCQFPFYLSVHCRFSFFFSYPFQTVTMVWYMELIYSFSFWKNLKSKYFLHDVYSIPQPSVC